MLSSTLPNYVLLGRSKLKLLNEQRKTFLFVFVIDIAVVVVVVVGIVVVVGVVNVVGVDMQMNHFNS